MRIYKGKETTSVNFDEKCVAVLEELNSHGFKTASDLYSATKPTKYPALWKRIDEMKEAKLIKTLHGRPLDYEITGFGKKVAKLLELKEYSLQDLYPEITTAEIEANAHFVASMPKVTEQQKTMDEDRSRI